MTEVYVEVLVHFTPSDLIIMVGFGHLTLETTGASPDLTCRKAEFWAGSEEPGQNDVTTIVLFFFPFEKHLAFFQILWNWFHSLPMLRIVLGRGRRRLRWQAWVVAESSPTRHSHESTGTDYWLRRLHPLTRRRPGPIAFEYFPAWPASHPKSTSPRTNEKRHNLVFDDTIRQDGPPGFDLVSRCCSFGRQSRSDTPSPKDSSISEPLTLSPPPFLDTSTVVSAPYHQSKPGLWPRLNHYPIDIISQQPEISALPTVLTRCYSRLLTSFLRHPTQESHDSLH